MNHTMTAHFHVGYNTPGYLPDAEPTTERSLEWAWRIVTDEIWRAWDNEYDTATELFCGDDDATSKAKMAIDARYLGPHAQSTLQSGPGEIFVPGPDTPHSLGEVFWVTECTDDNCDGSY